VSTYREDVMMRLYGNFLLTKRREQRDRWDVMTMIKVEEKVQKVYHGEKNFRSQFHVRQIQE